MGRWSKKLRGWLRGAPRPEPVSAGYELLEADPDRGLREGFQADTVAGRQHAAFAPILEELRRGNPREDFRTLARAVEATGVAAPTIVEAGCGSGWNAEVLARLLGRPFRYLGLDYSRAMIALAREHYPAHPFVVGDAERLPFRDGACDVLLSGTVLMHLADWGAAIRESRRVARRWCLFHTVPVVQRHETARMRKMAYGEPVIELVFNEAELISRLGDEGLDVRETWPSIPYDLEAVLGEPSTTKTYLCEVRS